MTPTAIPDTPGSGPNAPHPNDEDPAAFFGDDAESEQEPSLMPEDDEPGIDDDQADGEPDGDDGEADGEPEAGGEEGAHPEPASGEATPGQQFTEDGEKVEEVGDGGKETPVDPPPAPGDGGQTAQPADDEKPAASGKKAPPAAEAESQPKNGPRGYVVIREITLTSEYLEHFAKEIEDGKDPRQVYVVLEQKVEARNPAPVLTNTFKKHFKRLGQPLRLGAIPLSMWNIRTLSIKPKVIDENIAIED